DKLKGTGIEPLFPVWGTRDQTRTLADQMLAGGLRATLATIDPKQLDPKFAGREFDAQLLRDVPVSVDPCGEKGEFHTFCYAGPMFSAPIPVKRGEVVERDGFWFADILPA